MFENHLFNLNAGIAEALKSIKELKIFIVKLQQYEYSAQLRDIEKNLENAADQISCCRYPEPHKGLTPKGKLFYKHLFNYGAANNWKNTPDNFRTLLSERKAHLNNVIVFDDTSSLRLIELNKKLAEEESHFREFYDFVEYVIKIKGIKDQLESVVPGNVILKCYTRSNLYEINAGRFNTENLFYQLEFPLNDFVNSMPVFYDDEESGPDFLQTLPLKFRDEKICLLFSLLATDGILAWEDFLNIDRVELDLTVIYQFSAAI